MSELGDLGCGLDCLVLEHFVHRQLHVDLGAQVFSLLVDALVLTLIERVALVNDMLNLDSWQLSHGFI